MTRSSPSKYSRAASAARTRTAPAHRGQGRRRGLRHRAAAPDGPARAPLDRHHAARRRHRELDLPAAYAGQRPSPHHDPRAAGRSDRSPHLHIDFQRIDLTEKVTVRVEVEIVGVPEGVKNEGGMLDFVTREVEVECLLIEIPDKPTLDVTALHVGQHAEARGPAPAEGVALIDDAQPRHRLGGGGQGGGRGGARRGRAGRGRGGASPRSSVAARPTRTRKRATTSSRSSPAVAGGDPAAGRIAQ